MSRELPVITIELDQNDVGHQALELLQQQFGKAVVRDDPERNFLGATWYGANRRLLARLTEMVFENTVLVNLHCSNEY